MNIDELAGKALGIEVAKAMGCKEIPQSELGHYERPYPAFGDYGDDSLAIYGGHSGVIDNDSWAPWRSMDDCWEMDNENWLWRFSEHQMGIYVLLDNVSTGLRVSASAEWGDFPSKSIIYCHLRLRAALKAKGGEG